MTEYGFSDVAVQSAHAFRSIMNAMARPGRIQTLDAAVAPPEPLLASTAAVALTLCDFQTPVWIAPDLSNDNVTQYIRFHAGAPIVAEAGRAHFVIAKPGLQLPALSDLMQGAHEYPDRSATLILQLTKFQGTTVSLSGPGIRGSESFGAAGLGIAFWESIAENHARFPIGVDVIFTAPGLVASVPRSIAVGVSEPF